MRRGLGKEEGPPVTNYSTQVKVKVEFIYKREEEEKLTHLFIQMQKKRLIKGLN